jgi:allantoicase
MDLIKVTENTARIKLSNAVDLLAESMGGKALLCSDDFFAEMSNLLKSEDAIFEADRYTERGKWMDGWESRRKRVTGHDWCILRLGVPGRLHTLDIDTAYFLGNHAPIASVEACYAIDCDDQDTSLLALPWKELLVQSPLQKGSQNLFTVHTAQPITHLRLNMFPDGGIARFRAYGDPVSTWQKNADDDRYATHLQADEVDLAALRHGAQPLLCSDMFFGVMSQLIAPGRARVMGEGWETRRSRRIGHDWIIIQLAQRGHIACVIADTNHFKGNFPDSFDLQGIDDAEATLTALAAPNRMWQEILSSQKMQASYDHIYRSELQNNGPFTHVKLRIYPDGGVSRLRLYGQAI